MGVTDVCRFIAWMFLGFFILFWVYVFLILAIIVPITILLSPFIAITYFIWLGGDVSIISFQIALEAIYLILNTLADIWNAFSLLFPVFATFWNLVMELIILLISGFVNLVCGGSNPLDPGFDILDCDILYDLISIALTVAQILYDLFLFGSDITNLFAIIFKPVFCLTRIDVGADFFPLPWEPFNGYYLDCTNFCNGLTPPQPASCYGFTAAISWLLNDIGHFFEFLFNLFDFIMPFIYSFLFLVGDVAGMTELQEIESLWNFMEIVVQSDGELIGKAVLGAFINVVLVIPDRIYCTFLTDAFVECVHRLLYDICYEIVDSLSFEVDVPVIPTFYLGFPTDLCDAIGGSESCWRCRRCNSIHLGFFSQVPCTTCCSGDISNCYRLGQCGESYSFLPELVNLFVSIVW